MRKNFIEQSILFPSHIFSVLGIGKCVASVVGGIIGGSALGPGGAVAGGIGGGIIGWPASNDFPDPTDPIISKPEVKIKEAVVHILGNIADVIF